MCIKMSTKKQDKTKVCFLLHCFASCLPIFMLIIILILLPNLPKFLQNHELSLGASLNFLDLLSCFTLFTFPRYSQCIFKHLFVPSVLSYVLHGATNSFSHVSHCNRIKQNSWTFLRCFFVLRISGNSFSHFSQV